MTSPGIVKDKWYLRYPDIHAMLLKQYKAQMIQVRRQQELMKRFSTCNNHNPEHKHKHKHDNNAYKNHKSETTVIELKYDKNDAKDDTIDIPTNFARPERSHYSHELKANILRMDHYCIWLNNVVGLYNYKFFLLALIYLNLLCFWGIIGIIYRVYINPYQNKDYNFIEYILLLIVGIFATSFFAFSLQHLITHLIQIKINLTSIEFYKFLDNKNMAKHFKINWNQYSTHKYDFGVFEVNPYI